MVDKVLMAGAERADCVKAPPLKALFQTELGKEGCSSASTGCTSNRGVIGDIKLTTDGQNGYQITVTPPKDGEAPGESKTWDFPFDENEASPNTILDLEACRS